MCSYCGCEAEPAIVALMEDHASIASLIRDIERHLDDGEDAHAFEYTADLMVMFRHHTRMEERGLFEQLQVAGEGVDEVADLLTDHREIMAGLSVAADNSDGALLRRVLGRLTIHAQTEDNDLFPFALQRLPNASWAAIEDVHHSVLTRR